MDHPLARRLLELTDVPPAPSSSPAAGGAAQFVEPGVPVVAFGPGAPTAGRAGDEYVTTAQLTHCEFALRQWLT